MSGVGVQWRVWRRIFGVLLVLAVAVLAALSLRIAAPETETMVRTAVGEQRTLEVDGLRLHLGSATRVRLPDARDARLHLLRGELMVIAGGDAGPVRLQLVDTLLHAEEAEFMVRSRREELRLAVRHGVVVLRPGRGDRTVVVRAGERLRLGPAAVMRSTSASEADFAWVEGELVGDGRPLGTVLAELDRYFPGRILLLDKALADSPVHGRYSLTDPAAAINRLAGERDAGNLRLSPWLVLVY